MRWIWLVLATWLSLFSTTSAHAQDGSSGGFKLTVVLVPSFEAGQPFLTTEADRVRGLVEEAIAREYATLTMADVPGFADYSADVYLRSCPDGQYIGCVFVIGERAEATWSIAGQLVAVEGGYRLDVSIISVEDARVVVEFDVQLDGTNDDLFQERVLQVFRAVVNNDVQQLDERGDVDAMEAAEEQQAEMDDRARQFVADNIYDDVDEDRGDLGEEALIDDEEEFEEQRGGVGKAQDYQGIPPWEKVGLTRFQYKVYKKSKLKLRDFRRRLEGRKSQVLISAGFTMSNGPWTQRTDFWYVVPRNAPPVISEINIQDWSLGVDQQTYTSPGGELSIGIGATPWLEVSAFFALRGAPYLYRVQLEQQVNDGNLIEDPLDFVSKSTTTFQAGIRAGAIMLPATVVHPTFHLGASFWQGTNFKNILTVPDYLAPSVLKPNYFIAVDTSLGLAVDIGKTVSIWARGDFSLPLFGSFSQAYDDPGGDNSLSYRPSQNVTAFPGFAVGGVLSLVIRIPTKRD